MVRLLTVVFSRLEKSFIYALAASLTLQPSPAAAQSLCGPVTLVNFNGTNGQYPVSAVTVDSQGNLYGTTAQGGSGFNPIGPGSLNNGLGTIWKYSPGAGLTSLFSFSGATTPSNNGYRPLGSLLMDAQGNLYGTTYFGGNDFFPDNGHSGWGTIFKYSSAGVFSVLHEFSGPEGANPDTGTMALDSQGNLWGTTYQGGPPWDPTLGNFGLGTIFEYSPTGGLSNPLFFNGANGAFPNAMLTSDGNGNFYGTSYNGGANGFGTIFKYSLSGGLTTLVNFNGTNGKLPIAGVTIDSQGNLYGTTYLGGAASSPSNSCCGTLWKYSASTGFTTLVSFDGNNGQFPWGGVTVDSQGNLYGTTTYGGALGDGVVYEYSATGVLSTLVTFSGPNGWNPEPTLVFDSKGNLYGTTNQGGASGYGTVFMMTPNTGGGACGNITISSLALNPTTVQGGGTSQGTVTLNGAAPSGGTVVGLSSDSSFALVPGNVTVPAGATSATFTVTTKAVGSNTPAVITAALGNSTVQASMTVTPGSAVNISSLTLSPTSVRGGSSSTGTVTLSASAPSGGALVALSSGNTSVATVPASVTVAAGKSSATFSVGAKTVSSTISVAISGTYGGATKSATLTVTSGRGH